MTSWQLGLYVHLILGVLYTVHHIADVAPRRSPVPGWKLPIFVCLWPLFWAIEGWSNHWSRS